MTKARFEPQNLHSESHSDARFELEQVTVTISIYALMPKCFDWLNKYFH